MSPSFKLFLTESFKNLFSPEEKKPFASAALAQLKASYEKVGGLKGSGFANEEDFVKNIPFWKLNIINGKIVAAAYYKDKNGRKRIAISSDGSPKGKQIAAKIMIDDLLRGRSYVEQSSNSLNFVVKALGYEQLIKFAITPEKIKKLLKEEIRTPPKDDYELVHHPELKRFFYQRKIGDIWYTKIALGTINQQM